MKTNYIKKPVTVSAIQFIDDAERIAELSEFVGKDMSIDYVDKDNPTLKIQTLEGVMTASVGDYIIKGVKGEFYPCKPDIFEQTYEDVQPPRQVRIVKVEWIDSCASNHWWLMKSDIDNWEDVEPISIFTYGALVQEDENYIVVVQNYGFEPEQCCNLMSIPKGCIKQITTIEELTWKQYYRPRQL